MLWHASLVGRAHRIYMLAASRSVNRYNLKYRPALVRLRMASLLTLFELRREQRNTEPRSAPTRSRARSAVTEYRTLSGASCAM
jgi:hypothetical protein